MIGRMLGHYEILDRIGAGGMGEVYRARDARLQRDVALKILPPESAADAERRARFQREAQTIAALQHPGIVTIYSVEDVEGVHFLTMELVEGRTLAELLSQDGPKPEEVCELLLPLLDALAVAHAKGIIHRDLKPQNVMLTAGGQVKLLDFGVAKLAQDAREDTTATAPLTGRGRVLGTLSYMSPEQLRGEEVDARSDLFSLGILMYELVTGRHPFPGENAAETISAILRDTPPPCSELVDPGLQGVASLLERCLEKDPARRYQSADEMREDLARLKEAWAAPAGAAPAPSPESGDELRTRGVAAFARQDWQAALEALEGADRVHPLAPPDLERLAESAWWAGGIDKALRSWERAYAGYVEGEDHEQAGYVAVCLAEQHFVKRAQAVAAGWVQRAERHLADGDSTASGYLNRLRTKMCADRPDQALELTARTLELGRRFGDTNLEALGLMDRGCALVRLGNVVEGKALIDEAMAFATGGRLAPDVAGRIYCNMMSVCEELADYKRAGEWSEVVTSWCEPHSYSTYPGICRVHRASVMRQRGAWKEAEDMARLAGAELGERMQEAAANAEYEIGEIQLRRGNLDEADAAFTRAHGKGRDPLPGMALLRLAQGKADAARGLIQRGLDETDYPLARARLLPARIEIALATGDREAARIAVEELEEIGRRFGSAVHLNTARQGRGLLLFASGDAEGAARELRQAWKTWVDLDLPYEGARTRLSLGEAYRTAGNPDDAELELRAARSAFERLGAAPLERRASELLSPRS